jgi:hypothetical protein
MAGREDSVQRSRSAQDDSNKAGCSVVCVQYVNTAVQKQNWHVLDGVSSSQRRRLSSTGLFNQTIYLYPTPNPNANPDPPTHNPHAVSFAASASDCSTLAVASRTGRPASWAAARC